MAKGDVVVSVHRRMPDFTALVVSIRASNASCHSPDAACLFRAWDPALQEDMMKRLVSYQTSRVRWVLKDGLVEWPKERIASAMQLLLSIGAKPGDGEVGLLT